MTATQHIAPAVTHVKTTQRVCESLIREGASPTERHQCYPRRDTLGRRSEVVPGAALAAAVATVYLRTAA